MCLWLVKWLNYCTFRRRLHFYFINLVPGLFTRILLNVDQLSGARCRVGSLTSHIVRNACSLKKGKRRSCYVNYIFTNQSERACFQGQLERGRIFLNLLVFVAIIRGHTGQSQGSSRSLTCRVSRDGAIWLQSRCQWANRQSKVQSIIANCL